MGEYETTAAYAARVGITEREARERAAAGAIPGAHRIGSSRSRWAIPVPGTTTPPAPVATGGARDKTTAGRLAADLMSSRPGTVSTRAVVSAYDVMTAVGPLTTRPARALMAATLTLTALHAAHSPDRDARCGRCGWSWPCPDSEALTAALDQVHAIVTDGQVAA